MSWAWTRTFYATRNGTIFNFEAKRQRDDAVKHHGFEKMLSADAMNHYPNIVRVGWREYDEFIANAPTIIESTIGQLNSDSAVNKANANTSNALNALDCVGESEASR